jgi:outer membrane protein OmpA-like peptidoglycan-associated protein
MNSKLTIVSAVVTALALGACREERPPEPPDARFDEVPPPEVSEDLDEEEPPPAMEEEMDPEVTSFLLEIDQEIVRRCDGIESDRLVFHREAMRADPEHRQSLEQLAECVRTGDLAEERIAIIGFADAVGRHDYDFGRGGERAQSVAQYLDAEGVPRERIATMSMGEVFATPEDRETFEFERRVTIRLADEAETRPTAPPMTGRG